MVELYLQLVGIGVVFFVVGAGCALLFKKFFASLFSVAKRRIFTNESFSGNTYFAENLDDRRKNSFDLIIVGAGLSGCTLALEVTRRYGYKVLLIEKQWGDSNVERIVGELMQPGGMKVLEEFGLHDIIQKEIGAVPHFGYVMELPQRNTKKHEKLVLRYPEKPPVSFKELFGFISLLPETIHPLGKPLAGESVEVFCDTRLSQAKLPRAFAFHNYSLLEGLRKRCSDNKLITCIRGNVINFVEECSKSTVSTKYSDLGKVVGVNYQEDVTTYDSTNASSILNTTEKTTKRLTSQITRSCYAPVVFLCDGGYSINLRRSYNCDAKLKKVSSWVGILLNHEQWNTPLSNPGYACVLLLDPSPLLLYQISPTQTRCLVCVDRDVADLSDYLQTTVLPHLPFELFESFKSALSNQKILVRNSYNLAASPSTKLGLLALGDALNMRHALTGCGMTVCLNDVKLIVNILQSVDIRKSTASTEIYRIFQKQRRKYAGTLNILADALHKTVSLSNGKEEERRALRSACFKYLKSNGICSAGPIGMLSGFAHTPGFLTVHFFFVLLVAAKDILFSSMNLAIVLRLNTFFKTIREGVSIIVPFCVREKVTFFSSVISRVLLFGLSSQMIDK